MGLLRRDSAIGCYSGGSGEGETPTYIYIYIYRRYILYKIPAGLGSNQANTNPSPAHLISGLIYQAWLSISRSVQNTSDLNASRRPFDL